MEPRLHDSPNRLVAVLLCAMALALAFTSCRLRLDGSAVYSAILSVSRSATEANYSTLESDVAELTRSFVYSHRAAWLSGVLVGFISFLLSVLCLRRELCPRALAWPTLAFVLLLLVLPLVIIV